MIIKLSGKFRKDLRKGSLILLSVMIMIIPQAALAVSSVDMAGIPEPESMTIDDAQKGIVRVIAGTEDADGNFDKKSTVSGFIVSDAGNEVRIVTTLHSVDFGENSKVKVAVKNDATVDATVEKFSEKDFCILSVENKFNDKRMIPIRVSKFDPDEDKLGSGDEITVLGFPLSVGEKSDYTEDDVAAQTGKIVKTAEENDGLIEYEATVPDGFDGGVVVDKDGYVIGLINTKASDNGSQAMDIKEVDIVLDKEGSVYRSKDKDTMYGELYNLCDGAEKLYKKSDKDTKDEIYRTRENAINVLESGPYDRNSLKSALDDFKGVVGNAETKKPYVIIIVLGAIIVFLIIRLISLVKWNRQHGNGAAPAASVTQAPEPEQTTAPKRNKRKNKSKGKKAFDSNKNMNTIARLTVYRTGASYVLDLPLTTLGKSNEVDISIPDNNRISRNHAFIERKSGVYYLYDRGSTNGTYLNNMPVDANGIRLVSGDIIRLANEEIEFSNQ